MYTHIIYIHVLCTHTHMYELGVMNNIASTYRGTAKGLADTLDMYTMLYNVLY